MHSIYPIVTFLLLSIIPSSVLGGESSVQEKLSQALYKAVQEDNIKQAEDLLEQGADPNTLHNGYLPARYADYGPGYLTLESPLHWAARQGSLAMVKLLVGKGASIYFPEKGDKKLPLHSAAIGGQAKIVDFLISQGADPNARSDEFGRTPLHYVATTGAEVFERKPEDHVIHDLVREEKYIATAKLLIERGADYSLNNASDWTPLHYAAYYQAPQLMKFFLNLGMDMNQRSENGHTPLHLLVDFTFAIAGAHSIDNEAEIDAFEKKVQQWVGYFVIKHGADPMILDGSGWTLKSIYKSSHRSTRYDEEEYECGFSEEGESLSCE